MKYIFCFNQFFKKEKYFLAEWENQGINTPNCKETDDG